MSECKRRKNKKQKAWEGNCKTGITKKVSKTK